MNNAVKMRPVSREIRKEVSTVYCLKCHRQLFALEHSNTRIMVNCPRCKLPMIVEVNDLQLAIMEDETRAAGE